MKILPILLATVLTLSPAAAQQTLRIEGSNTFGEKLGPLLVKGFERANPDVAVSPLKRVNRSHWWLSLELK